MNEIEDFSPLKDIALEFGSLGDSYIYARVNTAAMRSDTPIRLNGVLLVKINKGVLRVELNLAEHCFVTGSLAVLSIGSLVKLLNSDGDNDVDLIYFKRDFLQNLNLNFAAISMPIFVERHDSDIVLDKHEAEIIDRYLSIFKDTAGEDDDLQIGNNIAASILAALIYQMVAFVYKRVSDHTATKGQRTSRIAYVHDFMKLVHVHYVRERSVAFYADKLYITPKYLSLLVKEATGKSAARWIDEFVLMEAKNLLRFSGKNVQQVAYSLNFTNQSSFGKYFKHLTGMSPTEYQKS